MPSIGELRSVHHTVQSRHCIASHRSGSLGKHGKPLSEP